MKKICDSENKKGILLREFVGKALGKRMRTKAFWLFLSFLAACVPENTAGSAAFDKTEHKTVAETESKDTEELSFSADAVGPYILYLQARQDGDYEKAVSFLSATVKADPDNAALISEMLSLLALEGRTDEAMPYAQAELKNDPTSLLAALVVIVQNVKDEKYTDALAVLKDFPHKKENAFLVPLLESWVYAGMGRREKALETLESVNGRGTEALYVFHKALMNDMFGEEEEAEENYELLLQEPGGLSLRAAQTYGNFLLRHNDVKKFSVLMDAYKKTSRSYTLTDESFFTAGKAASSSEMPMSVPTAQAGMAEAFFDVASSLSGKGGSDSALFFIRFALYLDPKLSLGRVLLGELLETQGRYAEAMELYESDEEDSETYYASRMRLALLQAQQKQISEAEKTLEELASKRGDLPLPWIETGDILLTDKQYKEAAKAYTKAIEKIPFPQKQHWTLFYSRGVAYERSGRPKAAEQDLIQALILSPDQPLALNYLGYFWLEQGKNIKKAKSMLERAAIRAPNEGFIADSLGWAYYILKDYKRSVPVLETAVSLDPGSAVINDHLGDAYWRSGRKREARYQWRKALDVNDDFMPGDRERTEAKLEKGLDAVGDKVVVSESGSGVKTASDDTKAKEKKGKGKKK